MSAFGGSSTCAVVAVGGCLDRRHDVHRPRDCISQEYNLVKRGEEERGGEDRVRDDDRNSVVFIC